MWWQNKENVIFPNYGEIKAMNFPLRVFRPRISHLLTLMGDKGRHIAIQDENSCLSALHHDINDRITRRKVRFHVSRTRYISVRINKGLFFLMLPKELKADETFCSVET